MLSGHRDYTTGTILEQELKSDPATVVSEICFALFCAFPVAMILVDGIWGS